MVAAKAKACATSSIRVAHAVSRRRWPAGGATDDNLGVLDGGNLVDASIAYSPSDTLTFTLYGRNLLDEVLRRSDFDLSGLVNSTYSPLKEGRALGVEVQGRLQGRFQSFSGDPPREDASFRR